jgi:hypothetical protein
MRLLLGTERMERAPLAVQEQQHERRGQRRPEHEYASSRRGESECESRHQSTLCCILYSWLFLIDCREYKVMLLLVLTFVVCASTAACYDQDSKKTPLHLLCENEAWSADAIDALLKARADVKAVDEVYALTMTLRLDVSIV